MGCTQSAPASTPSPKKPLPPKKEVPKTLGISAPKPERERCSCMFLCFEKCDYTFGVKKCCDMDKKCCRKVDGGCMQECQDADAKYEDDVAACCTWLSTEEKQVVDMTAKKFGKEKEVAGCCNWCIESKKVADKQGGACCTFCRKEVDEYTPVVKQKLAEGAKYLSEQEKKFEPIVKEKATACCNWCAEQEKNLEVEVKKILPGSSPRKQ